MSQNFGLAGGELDAPRGNVYDLQLRAAAADLAERIKKLNTTGLTYEEDSGVTVSELMATRARVLARLETAQS